MFLKDIHFPFRTERPSPDARACFVSGISLPDMSPCKTAMPECFAPAWLSVCCSAQEVSVNPFFSQTVSLTALRRLFSIRVNYSARVKAGQSATLVGTTFSPEMIAALAASTFSSTSAGI